MDVVNGCPKEPAQGIHSFGRPHHLRFEPPLHQGHERSCNVGRDRCKQVVGYLLLSFLSQSLLHTSAKQVLERLKHDLDALASKERLLDDMAVLYRQLVQTDSAGVKAKSPESSLESRAWRSGS